MRNTVTRRVVQSHPLEGNKSDGQYQSLTFLFESCKKAPIKLTLNKANYFEFDYFEFASRKATSNSLPGKRLRICFPESDDFERRSDYFEFASDKAIISNSLPPKRIIQNSLLEKQLPRICFQHILKIIDRHLSTFILHFCFNPESSPKKKRNYC